MIVECSLIELYFTGIVQPYGALTVACLQTSGGRSTQIKVATPQCKNTSKMPVLKKRYLSKRVQFSLVYQFVKPFQRLHAHKLHDATRCAIVGCALFFNNIYSAKWLLTNAVKHFLEKCKVHNISHWDVWLIEECI